MNTILFIDTNILLHYQMFDEINWCKILNSDHVTIVFPIILIKELNHHKDSNTNKNISRRAGKVLIKLSDYFSKTNEYVKSTQLKLILEDREPNIDFDLNNLKKDIQDDWFLASILIVAKEGSDKNINLVTNDSGLHLIGKARRLNINVFKLDEKYKISLENNSKQVEGFKPKPKLELCFNNNKKNTKIKIKKYEQKKQKEIIEELEAYKLKYPLRELKKKEDNSLRTIFNSAVLDLIGITNESINEYNKKLNENYLEYEDYLKKKDKYERFLSLKYEFGFYLKNTGKSPALDIELFLHFPDGFILFKQSECPPPPEIPKLPIVPEDNFNSMLKGIRYSDFLHPINNIPNSISDLDFSGPIIKKTNSYDVSYNIDKLKHHLEYDLGIINIVYKSIDMIKPFRIDYEIVADNIPEKITGELNINID